MNHGFARAHASPLALYLPAGLAYAGVSTVARASNTLSTIFERELRLKSV